MSRGKSTPPQKSVDTPVEAEPLRGEALQERAAELDIPGRSSMHADELREAVAEEAAEGAPKLETPGEPASLPEDTPRDEEPRMETPEEPAEPPKGAVEATHQAAATVGSKPKPRVFEQASPTIAALTVTLGGGPGPTPAIVISADEAALIAAQHNL